MPLSPSPNDGFAKITPKTKKPKRVSAATAAANRKKYMAKRAAKEEARKKEAEERARNKKRIADGLIEQLRAAQEENQLQRKAKARLERVAAEREKNLRQVQKAKQRAAAEREKNRRQEEKKKNGFTKVSPKANKKTFENAKKEEILKSSSDNLLEDEQRGSSPIRPQKKAAPLSPSNFKLEDGVGTLGKTLPSPPLAEPEPVTVVAWPPPRPISPNVNRGKLRIEDSNTPSGHVKQRVNAKIFQPSPTPETRKPINHVGYRAPKAPKPVVLSKWPPVSTRKADLEQPKAVRRDPPRRTGNVKLIQKFFAENSTLPQSKAKSGAADGNNSDRLGLSLTRQESKKRFQEKRRSYEENSDNLKSEGTSQEAEEGGFFPFDSDKATEKKSKPFYKRFSLLGGKKKTKKDNIPANEQSLDEMAPQHPAPVKISTEIPASPEDKSPAISSQVESSEPTPRVNYQVRYQGKTNLPLNELYGEPELIGSDQPHGESQKGRLTEDKERSTPPGPDVWMTPVMTEDDERAWKLRRVWDSKDLDKFERDHTVDDVNLMGALESLLGVPENTQEGGQDWLIRRVDDINGEVVTPISRTNEENIDHNQMKVQIEQIIEKSNYRKAPLAPESQMRAPRKGKKPKRKNNSNQKETGGISNRPTDSRADESAPRVGGNVRNQITRDDTRREEIEVDEQTGPRAYHYNPHYRVKPKSKDPAGQRCNYQVGGAWSMPFVDMASSKGSKRPK